MLLYRRLLHACGTFAGLLVGLCVLAVCFDVLARNLGWANLPWIVEVSEYALPLITLAAAPWLLLRGEHIRLDLIAVLLPQRWQVTLERIAAALGLLVCCVIVWVSIAVIRDAIAVDARVIKALSFPEWWLFLPLPLSFGLLGVECARRVSGGVTPPRDG